MFSPHLLSSTEEIASFDENIMGEMTKLDWVNNFPSDPTFDSALNDNREANIFDDDSDFETLSSTEVSFESSPEICLTWLDDIVGDEDYDIGLCECCQPVFSKKMGEFEYPIFSKVKVYMCFECERYVCALCRRDNKCNCCVFYKKYLSQTPGDMDGVWSLKSCCKKDLQFTAMKNLATRFHNNHNQLSQFQQKMYDAAMGLTELGQK